MKGPIVKVLVIEPYNTGSHAAWLEGLVTHSRHELTTLTLPGRWWRWRMRGGAVTIADRARDLAENGYRPDVLLVSGMIDLPLLRTLLGEVWGWLSTALYFHETQLSYPDSEKLRPDLSYAFTNWASALVADEVIFNSDYHRDVFFDRLVPFLKGFPDLDHVEQVERVRERSTVIPVGVDLSWVPADITKEDPPLVMWNHRWEHDKDPDTFLGALLRLSSEGMPFRVALCGENFQQSPTSFVEAAKLLGDRVVSFGHLPIDRYRDMLAASAVVASTARHEFFGVSVVEAVAAGATPVLPDRLSYPWLMPDDVHDAVLYPDGSLSERLAIVLSDSDSRTSLASRLAPEMVRRYSWPVVIESYDRMLDRLATSSGPMKPTSSPQRR